MSTRVLQKLKSPALAAREIFRGVKVSSVLDDPDHVPFRDDLSSEGWDLL